MGVLLWILFGGLAGWISSIIMKTDSNQGPMKDIVMGVIGAIVGGFLMGQFGQAGVTGFNAYSLIVAVIGAIIVIYLARMIRHG
jgi:uncharacterized membrane protein YeaQ/YmgE (transglycosylase-associated protein family)